MRERKIRDKSKIGRTCARESKVNWEISFRKKERKKERGSNNIKKVKV